eukprot:TRINITY_DN7678_c0_g1_i25.p1 TRINITY_DN7678_c0_g1~~TRINITY_DN7678_c0_g1_i25.p1  ORF type:complete len:217 (+),score=19.56 TRINITY_DN7678_c0_g1_i25:534-1184(+)
MTARTRRVAISWSSLSRGMPRFPSQSFAAWCRFCVYTSTRNLCVWVEGQGEPLAEQKLGFTPADRGQDVPAKTVSLATTRGSIGLGGGQAGAAEPEAPDGGGPAATAGSPATATTTEFIGVGGIGVAALSQLPPEKAFAGEVPADAEPLQPCPQCGRKFRAKALEKHINICAKVFMSKREKFDVSHHHYDVRMQRHVSCGRRLCMWPLPRHTSASL